MNSLMKFSADILEEMKADEMLLVRGGGEGPQEDNKMQPNNASGTCTGTNNADGKCGGVNNGEGLCGISK